MYTTCCLTQVHFLVSSGSIFLATAATDGYITFWDVFESLNKHSVTVEDGQVQTHSQTAIPNPGTISWQAQTRLHQSAIKCMTVAQIAEDSFLILTGGDDNALAITRITLGRHLQDGEVHCSVLLLPKAHASAVTAITLVDNPMADRDLFLQLRFATSSNDQRLKLWSACMDLSKPGVEGLEITKDSDVYTSVADVSSMDTVNDGSDKKGVLVCGVGMELWSING
jgi:WD40 repeat protein